MTVKSRPSPQPAQPAQPAQPHPAEERLLLAVVLPAMGQPQITRHLPICLFYLMEYRVKEAVADTLILLLSSSDSVSHDKLQTSQVLDVAVSSHLS